MTPARRTRRTTTTVLALTLTAAVVTTACGDDRNTAPGPSVTFAGTSSTVPATVAPDATTSPTSEPSAAATTTSTSAPLGDPVVALEPIASFEQPVDIAWRAGDPTAYVVERVGRVTPVRDGTVEAAVLDMSSLTVAEGERGLLGLTFGPDGNTAYVHHTDLEGTSVVAEYAVGADGTFDPASRRVLLTVPQPYPNHNGGDVTTGPDGMLYIGFGDGGAADDPLRAGLDVSTLLGKILRIDPTPTATAPYTVPTDNPFVGIDGARPEIWSVGLRNPWRFSFDSATGDLWVADVGQNEWEEVNLVRAGDGAGRGINFGWSAWEATHRFNDDQSPDGATPPVYEYPHGDEGCSVSGGAVYRGTAVPELAGWYVFGDYCSGRITGLRVDGTSVTTALYLADSPSVVALRASPDGEMYVVSIAGELSRLTPG